MPALSVQRLCLVGFNNNLLLPTNFTGSVWYQTRREKQERSGPSQQARPEALAAVTDMWICAGELTVSSFTLPKERERMCLRELGASVTKPDGVTPHKTALLCQRCLSFTLPRCTNCSSITYRTYTRADHFKNLYKTQISKVFKIKYLARGRIGLFSALLWTTPPNLRS